MYGMHDVGCHCMDCERWTNRWKVDRLSNACTSCGRPLDDHDGLIISKPRCQAAA